MLTVYLGEPWTGSSESLYRWLRAVRDMISRGQTDMLKPGYYLEWVIRADIEAALQWNTIRSTPSHTLLSMLTALGDSCKSTTFFLTMTCYMRGF